MKTSQIRNFLIGLVGVLAITLGLSIFTTASAATNFYYSLTILGSGTILPQSINDARQVVGYATSRTSTTAFLWENGTMISLGALRSGFLVSPVVANDINEAGQVVGYSDTDSHSEHAFLWAKGTMKDLGTLGGTESSASSINNRGQIVGTSTTSSGSSHAFLWANGTMKDLGTLGGTDSFAASINNKLEVVGTSTTSSGKSHPFMWVNSKMRDINSLVLANSVFEKFDTFRPTHINNNGQILGYGTISQDFSAFNCGGSVGVCDCAVILTPTWVTN